MIEYISLSLFIGVLIGYVSGRVSAANEDCYDERAYAFRDGFFVALERHTDMSPRDILEKLKDVVEEYREENERR